MNDTTNMVADDETISTYNYTCPEHGDRVAVFGEYSTRLGTVDGCNGCRKGLQASMDAARLQRKIAAVKADIAFANTDPDWIGERPGEWTDEEIERAARAELGQEDREFAQGWDQYKMDLEAEAGLVG